MLTLFNIVTLEGWVDIMDIAMEAYPWAWIYFVSFIVIGTFVVINLFIAIIINSLDEAKSDALRALQQPTTMEDLLQEMRETQAALRRLQERLDDQANR